MRRLLLDQPNSAIRRERDHKTAARLLFLLLCGILLSSGFLFAASQHFAAVSYGYRNEELRRERSHLLDEQRRLLLAREQLSSPANLENQARGLGMQPIQATQISVAPSASNDSREATARMKSALAILR